VLGLPQADPQARAIRMMLILDDTTAELPSTRG